MASDLKVSQKLKIHKNGRLWYLTFPHSIQYFGFEREYLIFPSFEDAINSAKYFIALAWFYGI